MSMLFKHQEEIINPMKNRENTFLLAPCGSGKTLAVIYSWLKERPTNHLIYVLPTRTLLKSIERDIKEMIAGKEEKEWYKSVKDLGYNIVNLEEKEFENSKKISITTDYGEERETTLYAHDIVLTTLDSYISRLYRSSLTPKRYRDLPIARIFNSTTVFDEAHMYDNYTHTLMKFTLRLLREGNAHHIVMTATMNEELKKYLELNNYNCIKVEDEKWMSFTGNKKIVELVEYKNKEDLPSKIKQTIDDNRIKSCLIVCNTVEKAQKTYEELNKYFNGNLLLLHSRFKSEDRNKHEEQIREFIRDGNFIVSTQVIEAGLDISVPNLITEVASGDSLVQRIGRCARRKGESGSIYILYSNEEKEYKPYLTKEVKNVISKLNGNSKYTFELEKQLVNTVEPPNRSGNAETRARGIILSAFISLSAFGDAWINVPTRDATPIYLYCNSKKNFEKEKENLEKLNLANDILKNCVRVDLRYLYGISKELKDFTFYQSKYDNEEKKLSWNEVKTPFAWTIAVNKKGIDYNGELGVIKNEQ